ncbi:dTDP-4-dehydrorhamnose 3,5-epimerase [Candidatus Falkowbacteria bacterium RIFOXYB2_FULL_47_14]|uniref:dTDP-4-dehydrorhamnose 3,5-epimerase n=1 Tax=Candidatus Falkowbacteria bacterium RIFOXYA2_FULL_47_19 TaxID=1797994 RepID=A0A1F5SK85_9BACT|nr:MAG: dTDP-4-dehydrorhamnose 3,5-epimerase [Candidatus Falkowbacteria bacterium RIFOXYA2_FULL_47_19]OGF36656.1 MAG: dTDP-4-dehydrorhamnose 3,5-epimerase [Candidatus Falkowbacteria bacterium RIFOXYC2_FULL_46_15]OGF43122.1 MAG: dTDP-4-dehydrorhamnose 3,5-epimerase [Candidatus Falkowbacteria bacterium RIFOXYB2_FULL_47_14]
MIEGVIVKNLKKYEDARGWLAEIWRRDESVGRPEESGYEPAMGYVSVTRPGTVRGPHEHVRQSDAFVFLGPGSFELHLWDRREGSATKGERVRLETGEGNPVMVIVPPGVVHGYKCVSETDAWCINLPDRLYGGDGKKEEVDEIRWEEDPESPYKID